MDLVNRLKFFLEKRNIAISQFADTCGIPRPTLSQILNGRNKKISDELISKIHTAYPDLSVLWLMFGEGEMETVANTQLSEPQIEPESPYLHSYIPANEANVRIGTPDSASFDFQSENSDTLHDLFTTAESPHQPSQGQQQFINDDIAAAFGAAPQPAATPIQPSPLDGAGSTTGGNINLPEGVEGAISFYPRMEGRPLHRVVAPNLSHSEEAGTTKADKEEINTTENNNGNGADPATDTPNSSARVKEPNQVTPGTYDGIRISSGDSVSVPADPGKKITNIVVFYSDSSFQSFYPS